MLVESYRSSILRGDGANSLPPLTHSEQSFAGLARGPATSLKPPRLKRSVKTTTRETRKVTEQLLPSSLSAFDENKSLRHREAYDEDITVQVLLLAPLPEDKPPFMKSIVDMFSRFGSVAVELIRLSGAADHFARVYVTSCEEDVKCLLPAKFQGAIYINNTRRKRARVVYSPELQERINRGLVRINPRDDGRTMHDEDEVHIHADGDVDIRMADEITSGYLIWTAESRPSRVKRMLNIP